MQNVSIIGIGKLGLCTALCFERAGISVLGIDVSESYVKSLNEKKYKTYEPLVEEYLISSKNFRASTSLEEGINFSDTIFILVQTPNGGGDKFYDHSILSELLSKINKLKPKNKTLVICCTVMPTYIDQIGKVLISDCEGCTLNYNPEFIAQGNIIKGFENPDIVLIGESNKEAGDIIEHIHRKVVKNQPRVCRMSPVEAEITKISINGFITTKLAYANMVGDMCDMLHADKQKVATAIGNDSRIGNKYFTPGYSYGGPCFPRDTKALSKILRQVGVEPLIPDAVTQQNESHVIFQAEMLLKQNIDHTFEGMSYKGDNMPIIEESAKLKIAKYLVDEGKKVTIEGNSQMIEQIKKEYGNMFDYKLSI